MAKLTDPDSLVVGTNITIDTTAKTFTLIASADGSTTNGLIAKDGVTLQAVYSKFILLWETAAYNKYPFPMYVIDAKSGQFQFGTDGGSSNGWKPADDTTRQMLRDGGWAEYLANGTLDREYVGIVSLGDVNSGAQLYFQRQSSDAPTNFTFADEVNQGIQVSGTGSTGNKTFFKAFVREAGYKYKDSTLADTGQTGTGAYTVNVLLSNESDLDIKASDAFITKSVSVTAASKVGSVVTFTASGHGLSAGDVIIVSGATPSAYNRHLTISAADASTFTATYTSDPGAYTSGATVKTIYDKIGVRYFSSAFTKDVGVSSNFGIVIEAGTHSGTDGSVSGSTLTSAAGGIDISGFYTGATLKIHGGTNKGSYTVTGVTATTVTISGSFSGTESSLDFTIYPANGLGATLQQIYTKVQYLLRQNSDIDLTGNTVTGKTASLLLNFVGSRLDCGFYTPTNPNGGGSGVLVEGLRDADSNDIKFYDNAYTPAVYPYASAGTLNFNSFLVSGGTGYYRMYITDSTTGTDDYGTATAITVNDKDGAAIAGTIDAASKSFTFDYTTNNQGGRAPSTDLPVTVVAGNKGKAKPVVATGTITQSKSISITLTAEQDRAYSNP